jgi:hypothetical protein
MKRDIIDHVEKTRKDYDGWHDAHRSLYQSELAALKKAVPSGAGLEIGPIRRPPLGSASA